MTRSAASRPRRRLSVSPRDVLLASSGQADVSPLMGTVL